MDNCLKNYLLKCFLCGIFVIDRKKVKIMVLQGKIIRHFSKTSTRLQMVTWGGVLN